MAASTKRCGIWLILVMLVVISAPREAGAARPTLGVAELSYPVPNVARGMAELLAGELAVAQRCDVSGPRQVEALLADAPLAPEDYLLYDAEDLAPLENELDYLLVGEITAFTVAPKEPEAALGSRLNDLARRTGLAEDTAQVALELRLLRVGDATEVLRISAEGLESRHGVELDRVTYGWSGAVDLRSDEFRRTNVGRAAYKALGKVLYALYDVFPLTGEVLAVSDDAVVIDWDERSGVRLDDEVTLLRLNEVKNSAGEVVWEDEQRIGSALVVEFQPGRCLCLVLDGHGSIREGDVARPLVEHLVLPDEADKAPER